MNRFRMDNTEGYAEQDLANLNEAFDRIMETEALPWSNDLNLKSWQDHVESELLARYEAGDRGDALLRGYVRGK